MYFVSRIPLKLAWNGIKIEDEISYFEIHNNSKTNLNQFVKDLSKKLIEKHFSGYFLIMSIYFNTSVSSQSYNVIVKNK